MYIKVDELKRAYHFADDNFNIHLVSLAKN